MSKPRPQVSRRRFIGGIAAAFSVPMIVPRSVLGGAGFVAPSEKIRVGSIGIGKMMYGSHLPHFVKMPELQVVGVCDVDTTRREAGKKRVDDAYGNQDCATYVDYHELLARDDVDAIACATPDHWHAMIILDTCKAGKDMYCEKPLTNNLMEAKAVMDAVNGSDIIFQTGSQQRASSNFRLACELVRNGHIGQVEKVMVGVGGPPRPCNLAGRRRRRRAGLGALAWLRPGTPLQFGPQPSRHSQSLPLLAQFL